MKTTFWLVQLPVSESEQRRARSLELVHLLDRRRELVVAPHDRGGLVITSPSSWWIRYGFSLPPARASSLSCSSCLTRALAAEELVELLVAGRLLERRPATSRCPAPRTAR